MDPFEAMMVALRFNERINQRDLEGLVELRARVRIKQRTVDHMLIIWAGFLDKIASFSFSVRLSKPFTQFTASTISIGQG